MDGTLSLINKIQKLKNKKFRHAYLKEHIRIGIASQIRILRNKSNMSQSQLAEIIGTKQSVVSRLEDPDSGAVNLNTLLKVAEALDVSLIVKFASFSKFIIENQDISPKALSVSNFAEDLESIKMQANLVVSDIIMSMSPTSVNSEITPNWTKYSMKDRRLGMPITIQDENVCIFETFPEDRFATATKWEDESYMLITTEANTTVQMPELTH